MKLKINKNRALAELRVTKGILLKRLIFSIILLMGIQVSMQAQSDTIVQPSWWFGVAGGANINFDRGTTQQLNDELMVPAAFRHGNGIGLYAAPLVEFHNTNSRWGIMLQAGYDNRSSKFDRVTTPCNCPADLNTKLSYITVEPSLRFAPFKSNFYLYAGPRLAYNIDKSFTYKLGANPDATVQTASTEVKGDFSKVNKTIISMQVGAGYDISLSSKDKLSQFVLSPFVAFQPYFGQSPRSADAWDLTTVRVGAALKFGRAHKVSVNETPLLSATEAKVEFSVNAPKNIPTERRVRETFPVRNYVFFNAESTDIPDRYVLLKKNQVKDFKEDQLEVLTPKRLSGRSEREMDVYYNVLNIVGDRMGKYPKATINLVGSSEKGSKTGKEMAEKVKSYLVTIFEINETRITTLGRDEPEIPSILPGAKNELELLRDGDRRVSIVSTSPALMMEFQSGPDVPLKPVEIFSLQKAPLNSYISFNVDNGIETLTSWSFTVKNNKGKTKKFGPYTQANVNLPGSTILGTTPEGDYTVTMIGKTKSGKTVTKELRVHMVLWTPSEREEGMRFSVIFEYDEAKVITLYEKYLTEIVTPKIPIGGTVIIHGHTDNIGDEAYNKNLSLARANDVKTILAGALTKAGRSDVKFEVYGFGEDQEKAPFDNNFPEEHFYNRTVIIDIIPHKE